MLSLELNKFGVYSSTGKRDANAEVKTSQFAFLLQRVCIAGSAAMIQEDPAAEQRFFLSIHNSARILDGDAQQKHEKVFLNEQFKEALGQYGDVSQRSWKAIKRQDHEISADQQGFIVTSCYTNSSRLVKSTQNQPRTNTDLSSAFKTSPISSTKQAAFFSQYYGFGKVLSRDTLIYPSQEFQHKEMLPFPSQSALHAPQPMILSDRNNGLNLPHNKVVLFYLQFRNNHNQLERLERSLSKRRMMQTQPIMTKKTLSELQSQYQSSDDGKVFNENDPFGPEDTDLINRPIPDKLTAKADQQNYIRLTEEKKYGARPYWVSIEALHQLELIQCCRSHHGTSFQMMEYQKQHNKESISGVVVEANNIRTLKISFIVSRPDGKLRKILDCRAINNITQQINFKIDGFERNKQILEREIFATVLDLKDSFDHISVSEQILPYFSFKFLNRTYTY
ncbi:MAG: hypothetical protein EZS28_028096 [Streblomastix strix]|uniref:Reverse transcriptase domain-containing protein n=1 Tax=Streblomastix strix TaxID=222440 RepID=A0A5J4V1F4_9EUKA|nr:MAG: hypothetical protein EZS28_028096 [Streblomastix strix]